MPTDKKFEMTQDEMQKIKEAMKNKEFMDLLLEYTKEISDPENRKKYEEEIVALEKQRGRDVRLLSPQSGFVVKTERITDGVKVFVNICTSPEIQECSQTPDTKNGKQGIQVSIPHSLTPARDDIDKAGNTCVVFDVCFHPKTYTKATEDIKFRQLLIDTAFDTLEKRGNTNVNRKKKRFPKMKYKGMPQTNIIRPAGEEVDSDSMPMDDLTKETISDIMGNKESAESNVKCEIDKIETLKINGATGSDRKAPKIATPEYKVIHRGYFDMQNFTYAREDLSNVPKELIVEIKLPLAKSAAGIDLDIFEKELVLDSKEPAYHLEISLPYKVNEADGHAQFDTAEKVLAVTLPVIKPELKTKCEMIMQPTVVDVTTEEEKHDEIIPISSDSDLRHESEVAEKRAGENAAEESVSFMLSSNFPANDCSMNDDAEEEDTILVDIDTIRQQLEKGLSEVSNDVDIEFDTSNFECFRPSSKLPPYCYTQTPEQINITVTIPEVKVVYLSLGFSEQQAYMSYPRNPDDANSPFWELVIRLDENCVLDKDNCGVDVIDGHMDLILRKRHDSLGLWEKFFVGLSENSLKVEFFTTDNIAEDMLRSISVNKVDNVDMEASMEEEDDTQLGQTFACLESRLNQLLQNQGESNYEGVTDDQNEPPVSDNQKNSMNFKEANGIVEENEDSVADSDNAASEISTQLDEIKIEGNEDLCQENNDRRIDSTTTEEESPTYNHGRSFSLSNESSYDAEGVLHSILKHSKSDGEYYCDTEEDELSCSANSFTDSIFEESPAPEPTLGRRRIKSVTFNDEPIIFEFAKLSKSQLKKQMKQERLRQASQQKSLLNGAFSKFSPSSTSNINNGSDNEQQKGKSKKKDKCEKKNRSYSDGLLQVPNSILSRHKLQKKKKKNKKNKQTIDESPSNSITDLSTPDSNTDCNPDQPEKTNALNNPLIFQLE